jgi:hydrogenase 3 maturation protease
MLELLHHRIRRKRLAIVGVGNPLRGDDAIGPVLVDRLQHKIKATLVNAGDVPENYLGVLEATRPEVVLIVDAVDLGAKPGDTAIIEIEQLAGAKLTTHNASLALFAQAVKTESGADVFALAIQPSVTSLAAPMSTQVEATLQILEKLFQELEVSSSA